MQAAVGLHFEDFGGRASKETDSSVGREEGLRERTPFVTPGAQQQWQADRSLRRLGES